MGIIFLKHIERCRAIVHVIDFGSDNKNPIKDFIEIKSELEKFNKKLLDLNQIVIANKCDLPNFQFNLANFKRKFPKIKIIKSSLISAKQNEINIIKEKMFGLLEEKQKKLEIQEINTSKIEFNLKAPFLIKSRNNGFFEITGELIQKIIQKIPLNSQENILRFNAKVKKIGLWDELIKKELNQGI
ncbi:GTPase Obg [Mesomycoplasma hyopneumoniae]|uniref:GTPase Obg n=1 Tax=Mesomycoplasma hyopneumoniae TaxID=2099 RepID=A0A223M9D9_MESHO|nr:GTPase Obg [Mesomycoplasma hyopneumoniae]